MPPRHTIRTERLMLRPVAEDDLDTLHALWTDPGVRRYLWDDETIPRWQSAAMIEQSQDLFLSEGSGLWAVFGSDGDRLIGFAGFWYFHEPPELQLIYGISPRLWGRGLASEAARALIRYGFEKLGMEKIVASTDAPNLASLRVMEKAGMSFETRVTIQGLDTVYYAIERQE